jgi:ABC-2 type transport system permease protein
MILIFIFGSIFSNMGKQKGINAIRVLVLDEDQTQFSQQFISELKQLPELKIVQEVKNNDQVEKITEQSMLDYIKKGSFGVGLVIEKGFEKKASEGDSLNLTLNYDPIFTIEHEILAGLIQKTLISKYPQLMFNGLFKLSEKTLGSENHHFKKNIERTVTQYFPNTKMDIGVDQLIKKSLNDTTTSKSNENFIKDIITINSVKVTGRQIKNPMFSQSVSGMALMFLLFSVNGIAGSLLAEKKSGTLKRILVSPIKPIEILLGKMSFCIILGIIQLSIMFIFGFFVFKLDIFRDVFSLMSVIIATSLACSSLGIFLATICKTERQVDSLSTLIVLSMSALGGSFVPSFIMPEAIKAIGKFTLNHWAMKAFTDIFWREMPFMEILPSILVLFAIFIVFSAISLQLFKRWDVN